MNIALCIQTHSIADQIKQQAARSVINMRFMSLKCLDSLTQAYCDSEEISAVIFEIDFADSKAMDQFTDLRNRFVSLPIILIGELVDDVLALNLRQNGAEDYWPACRIASLDVVTRICLAIERSEMIRMLENERTAMDGLMDAIHHGKINTVPDAQFPSGAIRVVDAKLAEQTEALMKQIELKNKELDRLAHIDSLTNLPNRRLFEHTFKIALARAKRNKTSIALLFIDVDNFKTVNDSFGHHVGDILLQEIAARIKRSVREADFCARIAGDEFAILVTDIEGPHEAGVVANKIVQSVAAHYEIDNQPVSSGCSIGIACYPQGGETVEALSQHADMAMYTAKQSGRNAYKYFTHALNMEHSRRLKIEQALKFAVEKKEMYLVYQPEYVLGTGELYGLEVFLRWCHPELGELAPKEFIGVAEKIGAMDEIGQWLIDVAIEQFSVWHQACSKAFKLSINISQIQLKPVLVKYFENAFKKYGEHLRNQVVIEITESAIMNDNEVVESVLRALDQMGIVIGVDDFGTGYSSLSHIQQLPIEILKIDRSFVKASDKDDSSRRLVKSVIDLANNLGLTVVAEGIETQFELDYLKEYGCELGQGYFFSKPEKADCAKVFLAL